ncbi:MAG: hypothetical protein R3293_20370 [Candidatus Promineifilaceae bacterium]|nr:hypothetical protein [Candidatus Promineifilaceae bacterium]
MSTQPHADWTALLQKFGLFTELSSPCSLALGQELYPIQISNGDWLFRQNDPGDSMYVLTDRSPG